MMSAPSRTVSCMFAAFLALSACDTPEERAQEHLTRGLELLAAGDIQSARNEFRNGFRLDASLLDARRQYAAISATQGNVTEAISQYLSILRTEPDNVADLNAVAELALVAGDPELAKSHLERAFGLEPQNGDTRSLKAAVDYAEPARRDAALVMARGVVDEFPGNLRAHELLISDQMARGDSSAALELVEQASTAVGHNLRLENLKLGILRSAGEPEALAAQLKFMTQVFPNARQVLTSFTRWFSEQNRTGEALTFLETLPPDTTGLVAVAKVELLRNAGRTEEAEHQLASLHEIFPELEWTPASGTAATVNDTFSRLPRSAGAVRQAIGVKLDLVSNDPENVNVHIELAELALRANDPALAKTHADAAFELLPDSPLVASLQAAADYRLDKGREAAVRTARHALDTETPLPRAYEVVINSELSKGKTAAAVELSGEAWEVLPNDASIGLLHLSALGVAGDKSSVDTHMELLVTRFPDDRQVGKVFSDWFVSQGRPAAGVVILRGLTPGEHGGLAGTGLDLTLAELLLASGVTNEATDLINGILVSDPQNPEARLLLARVNDDAAADDLPTDPTGIRSAIGRYLALVAEQPGNYQAHAAIAELALRSGDLPLARGHADQAFTLSPDDIVTKATKAAIDVRDPATRDAAVRMAQEVLAEHPDNLKANQALIVAHMLNGQRSAALGAVNSALVHAGTDETLNLMKLSILEDMQDDAAIGQQLAVMVDLYPTNQPMRQALVRWHVRQGNVMEGETFLRAAVTETSSPDERLAIVRYLFETSGEEAARAELKKLITSRVPPTPYQLAWADLENSLGNTDVAISYLRDVSDGADVKDSTVVQTRLAQLLAAQGSREEARAITEKVLNETPGAVGAMKLRAQLNIQADNPEAALVDLRRAVVKAHDDPQIFSIMALAHQRAGAPDLMGDALGMAARASGFDVAETLRYAGFLMDTGNTGSAEAAIQTALARFPVDTELLLFLGRIHVSREDWTRAEQVADRLKATNRPEAPGLAASLLSEVLQGQHRDDERLDILADLATSQGDRDALAELVKAHVRNGDTATAMRYVDDVLAKEPNNFAARHLKAGILVTDGEAAAAEVEYRNLIDLDPTGSQAYERLHVLLAGQGKSTEARAVLELGIREAGDTTALLVSKAGLLELEGDIPGAIQIYESLYLADSSNLWVANNLASLLTSGPPNGNTLDRAYTIARRFRDTRNPYFQDTYGWILHLRGDPQEALRYLEAASSHLSDNPQVQFHLAEARFAAEDFDAARRAYESALEKAAFGNPLPQLAQIKQRLSEPDLASVTDTN